jgi:anti-anti-sigma factor
MEVAKKQIGSIVELKLSGRLDAYWSDHLAKAIDESIRQGSHRLVLNMADMSYLSSAGIRVLLKYFKQLRDIKGSLGISCPSEGALAILELAGLSAFVVPDPSPDELPQQANDPVRIEKESAVYHVYHESDDAVLNARMLGNPLKLSNAAFTADDCQKVSFPQSSFGLGIGAFGSGFEDSRTRFGEFMAVSGIAACLPTDGTSVPDYVISEGLLIPELDVLYGLSWQGQFSDLIRFDAKTEPPGVASLSDVVEFALETTRADSVGLVIVTENAGLVGATLKKTPATSGVATGPFVFPEVREWISFTAERAFDRSLCVIAGIASRRADLPYQTMLRPLKPGASLQGHFHAAVFPYRPLQQGKIELNETINGLFETETLQSVIHLLADDRELEGVGQSELFRGACWAGPIRNLAQ